MKSQILKCMIAMTLLAATAMPVRLAAQSKYDVVELGELGGTAGSANGINNRGWITGMATRSEKVVPILLRPVRGSEDAFSMALHPVSSR